MKQNSSFYNTLKKIWPTIYRLINTILYAIFITVRTVVRGIFRQLS